MNKGETAENRMEKIVSLCKRRGFVFPGSEIYGGLANSWDYGPFGVELKNNIARLWWEKFVQQRDDMVGLDAAVIMNPKVWEASGHLSAGFSDFLSECKNCHNRIRIDEYLSSKDLEVPVGKVQEILASGKLDEKTDREVREAHAEIGEILNKKVSCPTCGKRQWSDAHLFNLMLRTFLGVVDDMTSMAYLRPEIAQAMFVNFKNVLDTTRKRLPFGIASQGKAFRNEITPGNFIFRTREFNLMEFEYFVEESEWKKWFEYWKNEMKDWLKELGVNMKKIREVEVPEGERAHYSQRTVDFEYDYPFGQKELYGLAYRTDFDLKNHEKVSGENLKYRDPETGKEFYPHVIEPTFGLDRSVLVTLLEAYHEDGDRVVLKLPPKLAPYKAAVFPLLANKPELAKLARKIYDDLRQHFMIAWDDRGNIGKRYYAQDEIGTPFCLTADFDALGKGENPESKDTVTVRERDTMKQERVPIKELQKYLHGKIFG